MRPEFLRRPPPRDHPGHPRRDRAVDGAAVLDVSSDDIAQPHGDHVRRAARRAADAAFAGIRAATIASISRRTTASIRAWARPTSCPSSRSKARRWTSASRSPGRSANASAASSASPCTSTSARPPAPIARTSPTCGAANSRASATRSGPTRRAARLRPARSAPDRGRDGDRRAAVPRRLQRLPGRRVATSPWPSSVAKAVRGSSGGLRYVKALGLEVDGQAQVSMNLVDTDQTPLYRAFDRWRMEAAAPASRPRGARSSASCPSACCSMRQCGNLRLAEFTPEQIARTAGARGADRRGAARSA